MSYDLNPTALVPGTVIAVRYPLYKHFAIVSDRNSKDDGDILPMLISLSYRTGKVTEESWHVVTRDKKIEQSLIMGQHTPDEVLARARACIKNDICYELLTFNCEHFVRYAHGLPVESLQVKRTIYGALLGATSCLLLPKITVARFAMLAAAGAAMSLRNSLHKI